MRNKNYVAAGFMIYLLLASLCGANSALGNPFVLNGNEAAITDIDFGTILIGQKAVQKLQYQNNTGRTLDLVAKVDCGCVAISIVSPRVANGATAEIEVRVDTEGETRSDLDVRWVLADQTNNQPLATGKVRATLRPAIAVSTQELAWKISPTRPVEAQELVLSNHVDEALEVEYAAVPGADQYFVVDQHRFTLQPNESASITIRPTKRAMDLRYLLDGRARFQVKPAAKSSQLSPWYLAAKVTISPAVSLIANPGAVIASPAAFENGKASIRLVLLRTLNSSAVVDDVRCANDAVDIRKQGEEEYIVEIQEPNEMVADEILVLYQEHGVKSTLRIPVFVYKEVP